MRLPNVRWLYGFMAKWLKWLEPSSHPAIKISNHSAVQPFNYGFTLIEIVVVIALFALTAYGVAAGYSNFEKKQRVKNAAIALKNDIRFAQNKALSGDKIADSLPPTGCPSTPSSSQQTLGGWYVRFRTSSSTSYYIAGDCVTPLTFVETDFAIRTVNLPVGVSISSMTYGTLPSNPQSEVSVFYRPAVQGVFVDNAQTTPPDFYNSTGGLQSPISSTLADLTITLSAAGGGTYKIIISPSGEVHEAP